MLKTMEIVLFIKKNFLEDFKGQKNQKTKNKDQTIIYSHLREKGTKEGPLRLGKRTEGRDYVLIPSVLSPKSSQ